MSNSQCSILIREDADRMRIEHWCSRYYCGSLGNWIMPLPSSWSGRVRVKTAQWFAI